MADTSARFGSGHDEVLDLATRLRQARRRAGLTQQELAQRAGVSAAAIRDLEQGRSRSPRPSTLRAIAKVLRLPALHLRSASPSTPPVLSHNTAAIRVAVLGPMELDRGGSPVRLGSGYRRIVLAKLALTPHRMVHRDELADLLWGENVPPAAVSMVQTYISRLRRILDPVRQPGGHGESLISVPGGYQLNLDADRLDLVRFRALMADARAAEDPTDAIAAMSQALDLWRGPPLADIERLHTDPALTALAEEWITATIRYAGIAEELSRQEHALPQLRELAARYPLHEPLQARFVAALAATGRQVAALAAYEQIRSRLADELGIDPGPELVEVHRGVLQQRWSRPVVAGQATGLSRQPEPSATVPAQLPPDLPSFAGRRGELTVLEEVLATAAAHPGVMPTVVVSGTAGVGKTTLAIHWANSVRDRFPGGQLYVDLRGFNPVAAAMDPAEAVRRFLDALGVTPQRIPAALEAQIALYRSLLAGRRMLVVLDNARDAEQARPLLPAAPGCLAIVTSRRQLTSLVAREGAQPVALELLSVDDARELLGRRLDPARRAETAAVGEIISSCARLPLALAIAAARAITRPGFPLAALATELRQAGGALDALRGGDVATDVRAVFSWSYQALSVPAARLFRQLGLNPGPDVGLPAAVSLAGLAADRVRPLLAELVDAHLLIEHIPGRYHLHDLLRAYSAELASTVDDHDDRHNALHRLLDHYLHTAHRAALLLFPPREPLGLDAPHRGVLREELSDYDEAMAWFTAEQPALFAAMEHSARLGLDMCTWRLAWTLRDFLYRRGLWREWVAAQQAALHATRRMSDRAGQAQAHLDLGRAYANLDGEKAHAHFDQALEFFRQLGDHHNLARTHHSAAWLFGEQRRFREAVKCAQEALDLLRTVGDERGQAYALNNIGWYHAMLDDLETALIHCQQALDLQREIGDRQGEAPTWDSLGYIHDRLGHYDRAVACYQEAVQVRRSIGDRYNEARTLIRLADTYQAAGKPNGARQVRQEALDILDAIDHPDAEQLRSE